MRASLLFFALLATATHAATSYFLPLYSYPDESTCWPELQEAAAGHPDLPWVVVINPGSGPGTPSENADSAILKCIITLRSAITNIKVAGYIRTDYGKRDSSDVAKDIASYAAWPEQSRPTMIFLDEMSNEDVDRAGTLYNAYAERVKSLGFDGVIGNPGTTTAEAFYPSFDAIVSYESAYADWDPTTLTATDLSPYCKQIIMIHSVPSSSSSLSDVLDNLITESQVGGIWLSSLQLTDTDIYQSFASDFGDTVDGVAERNGALSASARSRKRRALISL